MNKSQATREKLCETAIEIAAREGLAAMTLDNVARHAGVSKGGVTYHFPSKDKLLEAVVEHFGERLERLVLERVANDPFPRHRWARAMLDCTFDKTPGDETRGEAAADEGMTRGGASRRTAAGRSRSGTTRGAAAATPVSSRLGVRPADWPDQTLEPLIIERFFLAVLAAATTHPGVIAPLRGVGHRVRERLLADPRDGFDQLLLWLALDGLLLWQFAGLIDRTDPLFAQIGRELRARVDAGSAETVFPAKAAPRSPRPRKTGKNRSAKPGSSQHAAGEEAPSGSPAAQRGEGNGDRQPEPRRRARRAAGSGVRGAGVKSPAAGSGQPPLTAGSRKIPRSVAETKPDPPGIPVQPLRRRNRSA